MHSNNYKEYLNMRQAIFALASIGLVAGQANVEANTAEFMQYIGAHGKNYQTQE